MICILCEKEFDEREVVQIAEQEFVSVGGHNPAPLSEEGRCCTKCNFSKVLPARLENMYNPKTKSNGSN